jgi:integrase
MALTVKQIEKAVAEGKNRKLSDGRGLYLVTGPRSASWYFRYERGGKEHWMSLEASWPDTKILEAQELAIEPRKALKRGDDPLGQRRAEKSAQAAAAMAQVTVKECAIKCMASRDMKLKAKTASEWKRKFEKHVYPIIGDLLIGDVDSAAVQKVLDQHIAGTGTRNGNAGKFWDVRTRTAWQTRMQLEKLINFAMQKGYRKREGYNPAAWDNLNEAYTAPWDIAPTKHAAALPCAEIPAFIAKLDEYQMSVWKGGCERATLSGACAARLIMLTAARITMATDATWSEFDLDNAVWTIPGAEAGDGARMKGKKGKERPYRVPLAPQVVELLKALTREEGNAHVFIGRRRGDPISGYPIRSLLDRLGFDFTPHGFRTTFMEWGRTRTRFESQDLQMCLAHLVGSRTERSYDRDDVFDKRRKIMNAWADYCFSPAAKSGAKLYRIA